MVTTQEIQTIAETLSEMVTYSSMTIRTNEGTIAVTVGHLGQVSIELRNTQRQKHTKLSDTRKRKIRRLHPTCVYCRKRPSDTVDHVLPKSRGGSHSESNLVGCCSKCNLRKGDRTPKEAGMKIHYPSHLVKTFKL